MAGTRPWWAVDPVWSKTLETGTYPLTCHLLDTAAMAGVLWDEWLRPGLRRFLADHLCSGDHNLARRAVMLAAGLHDIGKASPIFQAQAGNESLAETRRALTTAGLSLDVGGLRDVHKKAWKRHEFVSGAHLIPNPGRKPRIHRDWIAFTACSHHGTVKTPDLHEEHLTGYKGLADREPPGWSAHRDRIADIVQTGAGLRLDGLPPAGDTAAVFLVTGLVSLADHLASTSRFVDTGADYAADFQDGPRAWIDARTGPAHTVVAQDLGLAVGLDNAAGGVLGKHAKRPRPAQAAALAGVGGGLWTVMAPTGSGKTETALLRHFEPATAERLLFAMPTQATTTAMMDRLATLLAPTGMVAAVAHGMAITEDFYNTPAEDERSLHPTEFTASGLHRLMAPVAAATIDQPLAAVLGRRYAPLLLLAVTNAHLVVDEAHLMDHYQDELLGVLLRWMAHTGGRVTLLSATLGTRQLHQLESAYTGAATGEPATFPSHRTAGSPTVLLSMPAHTVNLANSTGDERLHTAWARQWSATEPRARLGVIVNTVARAQQVAADLDAAGLHVVLLHSRMTAAARAAALRELLDRAGPNPARKADGFVMVATQAAEASLDIDLDRLSTDLAPAEALIQRFGRCWRRHDEYRHQRSSATATDIHLIRHDQDGAHLPYFHGQLQRTWAWLAGRPSLTLPGDVQDWVEASSFRMEDAGYGDGDEMAEAIRRTQEGRIAAGHVSNLLRSRPDRTSFCELVSTMSAGRDMATRLIDQETKAALVIDPDGISGIPGAWPGTLEQLARLPGTDRQAVRTALLARIPTSSPKQVALLRNLAERMSWQPRSRMLSDLVPITVNDYKEIFG